MKIAFQNENVTLWHGDCREWSGKADAVVSDPPYGMNLDTDNSRFSGGHVASQAKRGNGIGTGEGKPILNDDKPAETRNREHPCQKTVGLMAWCTDRAKVAPGATVLDPYAGSGTTRTRHLVPGTVEPVVGTPNQKGET